MPTKYVGATGLQLQFRIVVLATDSQIRVFIDLLVFSHNSVPHLIWKCQHPLKVGVFVETEVITLEKGTICVPAKVTIESGQDRLVHSTATIWIDVAQPPVYPPTITIICKGVWHERPRCNGWHLNQRFHFEVHPVRSVLHSVLLHPIQTNQPAIPDL